MCRCAAPGTRSRHTPTGERRWDEACGPSVAPCGRTAAQSPARCPMRCTPPAPRSKLCTLLAAKHLDRLFARATAQQLSSGGTGAAGRDASVAVHPGLVDTSLARGYFKQTAPAVLRPLSDLFFDRLFCPYLLRRWVWRGGPCAAQQDAEGVGGGRGGLCTPSKRAVTPAPRPHPQHLEHAAPRPPPTRCCLRRRRPQRRWAGATAARCPASRAAPRPPTILPWRSGCGTSAYTCAGWRAATWSAERVRRTDQLRGPADGPALWPAPPSLHASVCTAE